MTHHHNKARLQDIRKNLIRLFSGAAHDVQAEINAAKGALPQGGAHTPHVAEFARNLADTYSYAYALCRSEDGLKRAGGALADDLIAHWGQAQMLKVMPELIDDPDPNVQESIHKMLDRVEAMMDAMAVMDDGAAAGRNIMNQSALGRDAAARAAVFSATGASRNEQGRLARLTFAGEVLANVQKTSMNICVEPELPGANL